MTASTAGMSDDETAIRQLVDRWMAGSMAGDTAGVLGLMTDDVVFMVAGREPFGKAEFEAASLAMQGLDFRGRSEIIELQVCGDWAWLRNRIDVTLQAPGSVPLRRSGQTLTVLRKGADGAWRVARDANFVG